MSASRAVTLYCGESRWMTVVTCLLCGLATGGLLLADSTWSTKGLALLGLLITSALIIYHSTRSVNRPVLRMIDDGTVTLLLDSGEQLPAELAAQAWTSAHLTVITVHLLDGPDKMRLLVSQRLNDREAYRKFLKILRLGTSSRTKTLNGATHAH